MGDERGGCILHRQKPVYVGSGYQEPAVYMEERIFSRLAGGACRIYWDPHEAAYAAHVRCPPRAVLTFFVASQLDCFDSISQNDQMLAD